MEVHQFSILENSSKKNLSILQKTHLCRIGFVTQDDVLFPHLTVRETLTYAARLRLPKRLTKEEKDQRAADVIYELGLER